MSEPAYFILAALMNGQLHGYAITKTVSDLTDGRVAVAVGTLYSVLDRLSHEGYVTVTGEEIVNGRARRYFSLTETGSAALDHEAERMALAARVVTRSRSAARGRHERPSVQRPSSNELGVTPA